MSEIELTNLDKKFFDLIRDQFVYGGKKYAGGSCTSTRETTDILFDVYGVKWLLGTMNKYCYRYTNLKRERDILKIATYAYLLWLKRGFHIMINGINDPPIDTNIENKTQNFDKFITQYKYYYNGLVKKYPSSKGMEFFKSFRLDKKFFPTIQDTVMNTLSFCLQNIIRPLTWESIYKDHIFSLVFLCQVEWMNNFSTIEKHDTDTFNDGKI